MTQAANSEIDNIIAAGQVTSGKQAPVKPILFWCALSMTLLWACFTPLQVAPAAWVALSPLCILIRTPSLTGRQYRWVMYCGWLWGLVTLQWIRLGDPAMYLALLALGFYISLYFPVFLAVSRRLVRSNLPIWLVVPVVWTALDFLRAWLMTGFAWYYLGHSQYRWIELIQIADITGVYGITFLTAMSAAAVSELIPESICARPGFTAPRLTSVKSRATGTVVCSGLVVASVIYGSQRQMAPDVTDGPVVALVQGYFAPNEKHDPQRVQKIIREHDMLNTRAAQLQPDLIVWPETMWPVPSWSEDPKLTPERLDEIVKAMPRVQPEYSTEVLAYFRSVNSLGLLVNRSQECGIPIMFGLVSQTATSRGVLEQNSAAFVRPDMGYIGRYDKMHCVVFGEYTPLKSTFPFLADLRPPGMPELEPGRSPQSFEANGVRYAPAICFEDTVPRVIRRIVNHSPDGSHRPDVLVNLTNDAWFHGSTELDQHLITSLFRCVEIRRPMVRAVNGGISAFIDSNGRIRDPDTFLFMKDSAGLDGTFEERHSMIDPDTGNWYRNCSGVWLGQLPLDGRDTVYLKYGDWFAMLCSAVSVALLVRSLFLTQYADPPAEALA